MERRPIAGPRQIDCTPVCRRGTYNGAAAEASPYEFAPCIREQGHTGPCDSGPVGPEPPRAA